jgi:glycosyltransferase involved in cell wall biosynthesis
MQSYLESIQSLEAMDEHCKKCAEEINPGGFDLLFGNACCYYRVASIARYVEIPTILYLQEPFRALYEALPKLPWLALDPLPGRKVFSYWRSLRFVTNLIDVQALRVQAREERRSAEAFDRILVNSLYSRESVFRAYGLDSRVCYLGIDTGLFKDMGFQRENFVIGVGAFTWEKNIDFILRSLAKIRKHRPKLVWVGNVASDPYLRELVLLAQELNVSFEAKIRIDDEELVQLLNRAKIMVYAPHLEPFGLAPLEANACGLPVVAVAEGGVRETVVDGVNGILVAHDHDCFASAVEQLRQDEQYWQRLSGQSRCLVEQRWSLEAAIDRLETQFTGLLGQRSQPDPTELLRTGSN